MDSIEKLITSTKDIPTASPSDKIGSILKKVKSSHDPIFVLEGKSFLGIVSGSQSLFKKRYPKDTKAATALVNPPKLTKNASIYEVSKQMLSTKIYTLPVFDGDSLVGVISARAILSSILLSRNLVSAVGSKINIEKPITSTIHTKVRNVYSTLRKEETSRIVITGEKGQIIGIITRRDVQEVFTSPPAKGRSGRTNNNRAFVIDDRDLRKFDFPIAEYVKVKVVSIPATSGVKFMLAKIFEKKLNSIILSDKNNKPVGIVSIRSFLEALSKIEPEEKLKVIFSDKHKILDVKMHKDVVSLVQKLQKRMDKVAPIQDVKLTLDADKNPKGLVRQYDIHLHVNFKSGKVIDTKVQGRNLNVAIRSAVEKLNNQIKINHKKRRR